METILVPLDGSALAEEALPHALALARRYRAELVLVSVTEQVSQAMLVYLEKHQVQWASPDVPVRVVAAHGDPAGQILRTAGLEPATMIVMRSHGRHGFSRMWLGSVTDKVVRHAACPVLVVQGEAERTPVYRRILVPLDGSSAAERALNSAILIAEAEHATMTLMQVLYPPAMLPPDATPGWTPCTPEEVLAEGQRYLKQQATLLYDLDIPVDVLARLGSPAEEILTVAREYDLIVMTTHTHPWLERWLFGSVATRVSHHANCPVLLVPGDARGHIEAPAAPSAQMAH